MIPDGNYLEYNLRLYYSDRKAVNHAIKTGENTESILTLLEGMKHYAEEYDKILFDAPGIYKFTVPHLSMIEEDTREWIGNQGARMSDEFKEFLQDKQFDFLRGSKAFQNLTQ
jgi:hypothetical protein